MHTVCVYIFLYESRLCLENIIMYIYKIKDGIIAVGENNLAPPCPKKTDYLSPEIKFLMKNLNFTELKISVVWANTLGLVTNLKVAH